MKREKRPKDKKGAATPRRSNTFLRKDLKKTYMFLSSWTDSNILPVKIDSPNEMGEMSTELTKGGRPAEGLKNIVIIFGTVWILQPFLRFFLSRLFLRGQNDKKGCDNK